MNYKLSDHPWFAAFCILCIYITMILLIGYTRYKIGEYAKGAFYHFPRQITVIDIGGQDTKVIKLDGEGKRTGFKMNRKCAAGTGTFLEEIAGKLQIEMDQMNELAFQSENDTSDVTRRMAATEVTQENSFRLRRCPGS